ncbi:MAG TPA: IS1182 family transposase [Bradyrhizobium sp.]|nr:IS1182 family transposase [Bradyrhizobium sp.]
MMGRQQHHAEQLFYAFRLERHIPSDHLLRHIDGVLDLRAVRRAMEPYYADTGRPSVDPELMIRMLLIGYAFGIRSERRLCSEVHLNLAYRWFCRLGLEGAVPDHSTFSKNRHGRFRESDLFRFLFEDVVRACLRAGLVGGEGFAIDASVIEADASRGRKVDGRPTTWPEDEQVTRPVREYLAALDEAMQAEAAKNDADNDFPPGNPSAEPKVTSLTDPAAAWTNKGQMKVLFAYGINYLLDLQASIIVDVQATPARWSAEVAATKTMLERTETCFELKPQRLAADTAYGSGLMIGWLMQRGIEPHMPLLDREHQTNGFFTRADFAFDPENNVFVCPGGKHLRSTGLVRPDGTIPYLASTKDCRACPLRSRCTKGAKRIVTRNLFEQQREHVRALAGTAAFEQSARERRKVEMRFAHLKRHLGFRRLRLRGLTGASDEFLLVAIVQNLKKLARFLTHGPPTPAEAIP